MALVSCTECGADISLEAAACPHCGHPRGPRDPALRSGISPIRILIVVAIVLAIAFYLAKQQHLTE